MSGVEPQFVAPEALHARRVYIIDDDSDVRKSLNFLLESANITAWPFGAAADFLDQIHDLEPAPILLDIRMAEIDGLDVLAILKERKIGWPVIIMTAFSEVSVAVRAMKLGAIEFIEKPFVAEVLQQALTLAFTLLEKDQAALRSRENARKLFAALSRRESEVIHLLMEGAANKVIANRLELSVRTVELYRSNALIKLGVKSIAEVMALAVLADIPLANPSKGGDAA